jgi:ribosomal protein S18 acetylase RimI-like enzyme
MDYLSLKGIYCIYVKLNILLEYKNITLEVNSNNKRAFNLYKSSGFEIKTAIDYYRKKI